jgi:hypothetical protein
LTSSSFNRGTPNQLGFARVVASCGHLVLTPPRHVIGKRARWRQEAVYAARRGRLLEDQAKCSYSSLTNMSRINEIVSTMDNPKAHVLDYGSFTDPSVHDFSSRI